MDDWHKNSQIKNVEQNGDKLIVTYTNGKPYEVPAMVKGKPLPFTDPYDKKSGRGFMVPNSIIMSYLSSNAKLCYCALRASIVHNVGFTFINTEQVNEEPRYLTKFMSAGSKNTVKKAYRELEYFRVIDVGDYTYKGVPKKIYVFLPESEWRLPETKEKADAYQKLIKEQKANKKSKSNVFIFDSGQFKGMTMEDAYKINPERVQEYAESSSDKIKTEAQRVIDSFYCPEPA